MHRQRAVQAHLHVPVQVCGSVIHRQHSLSGPEGNKRNQWCHASAAAYVAPEEWGCERKVRFHARAHVPHGRCAVPHRHREGVCHGPVTCARPRPRSFTPDLAGADGCTNMHTHFCPRSDSHLHALLALHAERRSCCPCSLHMLLGSVSSSHSVQVCSLILLNLTKSAAHNLYCSSSIAVVFTQISPVLLEQRHCRRACSAIKVVSPELHAVPGILTRMLSMDKTRAA